jgi:hypothetical protein
MICTKFHHPQTKIFLFGTQYKRHNFFLAIFHKASGLKHSQAIAKGGEEGSQ